MEWSKNIGKAKKGRTIEWKNPEEVIKKLRKYAKIRKRDSKGKFI